MSTPMAARPQHAPHGPRLPVTLPAPSPACGRELLGLQRLLGCLCLFVPGLTAPLGAGRTPASCVQRTALGRPQ